MNLIKYVIILLLFFTNIYAKKERGSHSTKNLIGQKNYIQHCSSCHGDARRGGTMGSILDWKDLFSDNANLLIQLHSDDATTKKILDYLNSSKFIKDKVAIKQLLQEFAYDSEYVPTCN